jgi:SAM-dependent methyltransferase
MATRLSPEDAAELRSYERDRHNALAEGYIGFFAPVTALAIAPLLDAIELRPGMKLLDVPTGPGALAAEATRRGATVIGIDNASAMIEQARKRHPGIDFKVGEVEDLPLPDGGFDAVVCAFGLGHFPAPEAAVAECLRALKPGGALPFPGGTPPTSSASRVSSATPQPRLAPNLRGCSRRAIPACASPMPARFAACSRTRLADISLLDLRAMHLVPDAEALWKGAIGGMALSSSLIVSQDAATQRQIRAAVERKAAPYLTRRGLELPVAFRVGAGRKQG